MSISSYIPQVLPQSFQSTGTTTGIVHIAGATQFRPRQQCTIRGTGLPSLTVIVSAIINVNALQVATVGIFPLVYPDLHLYTPATAASISAPFQLEPSRNGIGVAQFFTRSTGSPDMNVNGLTAPVVYTVAPAAGTRYTIYGFGIQIVAPLDSTQLTGQGVNARQATMPRVAWDKFAGLTKLTNGVLAATTVNNAFSYTGLLQQHADWMLYPNVEFQSGSDGTATTWFKYDVSFNFAPNGSPLILDSRTGDNATFTILDNLSSLLYFRILTNGIEEDILTSAVYL